MVGEKKIKRDSERERGSERARNCDGERYDLLTE